VAFGWSWFVSIHAAKDHVYLFCHSYHYDFHSCFPRPVHLGMTEQLEGTEAAAQRFVFLLGGIWSLVELGYRDARRILDVVGEEY